LKSWSISFPMRQASGMAAIERANCRPAQNIPKIERHSRCVEPDTAQLLIQFATAAKTLEIAQLEVRDYLDEFGKGRRYSSMWSDTALYS
jgi:hypothetical protein